MRKLIFLFVVLFLFGWVEAQQLQDYYAFYEGSGNFYHLTGGNYLFGNYDSDDGTAQVNIGFDFHYDNDVYNTCYISTNGVISFTESNISYYNVLNPATDNNTGKKNIIAPLWDNMYQRSADNGAVIYKTEGTAPNRRFYVEWKNISWRNSGSTVSFILVLYETTNNIEFRYGPNNSTESRTASIGISRMINPGSNTFMSVTPGNPATMSYQSDNNTINTSDYPGNNTFYYFKHLTYIPDANFETYLETHDGTGGTSGFHIGNGTDGDHYVLSVRAQYATDISAAFKSISSLSGIQDFTHLEILNVYWNNLSYLNVGKNVNLTGLYCGHNNLSSLDVSNNPLITILKIGENNLTSIDLSNLTALDEFIANDNQFSSIDLSNNTALTWLDLSNNQLTGINLNNNTNLYILELNNNQIGGSFNTAIFPNLSTFEIAHNQITSLDLDSNPNLTVMRANDNHLSSLSIQNGHNGQLAGQQNIPNVGWVSRFKADNNPYLFCIYVDDEAAANAGTGDYQDWESGPVSHYVETDAQCEDYVTYINDSVFEHYLETHDANGNTVSVGASNSMGNGIDGDNLVYTERIENVTSLNISNLSQDIHQMGGIEGFAALQYLNCNGNLIVNLDLSNNTNLTELYCVNNRITNLTLPSGIQKVYAAHNRLSSYDLSPFTALTHLDFGFNNLTSITANNMPNLVTLNLNDNQLTGSDISGDTALTNFNCNNNALTNLNIGTIAAIRSFLCNNNNLTGILDLSHLSIVETAYCANNQLSGMVFYEYYGQNDLMYLDCSNNQMVELDLSTCTTLEEIDCSNNQLTLLNIASGNNTNLGVFDATNNPDLTCVQVDDESYMNANWANAIDATASYSNNCHYGETYVPDDNFEHYLETHDASGNIVSIGASNSMGNGVANDDYVSTAHIQSVTSLNVSSQSISDLTGIEDFAALNNLNCYNNNLTQLDVSNNTNLSYLVANSNQLTSINVNGLTNLHLLNCSSNQLTNIDLSGLSGITGLYLGYNNLTSLDLSDLINLVNAYVYSNNLTDINVSNNPALQKLYCFDNNLSQLDVSNSPDLTTLSCSINQLTSLDLDNNAQLDYLWCMNNQLTELHLQNGANNLLSGTFQSGGNTYARMRATGNPNLSCIFVDNATDATNGTGDYQDWEVDATSHFVETQAECDALNQHTLTVNTQGQGSVALNPAGGTYQDGTQVTLTATPAQGWQFDHWSGDLSGSTNPATITMDADKTVTAVFTQIQHSLTVNTQGQGSVALNPAGGTYNEGTQVTLTATPSQGWQFDHWSGDLSGSTNPATITMDSDKTVTAVFTQIQHSLTVNTQGQGSVALNPTGGTYNEGTQVTLTATPSQGWQFDHWSGDLSGSTNPATITMDSDKTVTAVFTQIQHTLTVNTQGQGSVALNPTGGTYNEGTQVTLTATPAQGWQFDHWSGDLSGSTNPATITMDSDKTVTAVFTQIQHTLTVNTQGQGSVALNPAGGTYNEGTQVTLTATPAQGWQFDHWSGDLSGSTNPATITMDSDKTVTAVFTQIQHTLTVNTQGQGSVALNPTGGTYNEGTQVTLTATPSQGWQFDHWSGDLSGSTNPATITMDADKTVTAVFTQIQYHITTSVTGQGTISLSPAGGTYTYGTQITVTATPDPSWQFTGWSGDLSGTANPVVFNIDSDLNIVANFAQPGQTYVPDDNFEAYLEAHNMGNGVANDDYVTTANIENVTTLNVFNENIADLTGIQDFTALQHLACNGNNLTSLDVSHNTALTYLDCGYNDLTGLDVSNNTALETLSISFNHLTALDLSMLASFVSLDCSNNQLTDLNVQNGNNTNFTRFIAHSNPDLTCIFVDDANWSTSNWTNIDNTSHFVETQTQCDYYLSVDDMIKDALQVYPNPVGNYLTIRLGYSDNMTVSVYNMVGQEVVKPVRGKNEIKVNLSQLPSAGYIVKIAVNGINVYYNIIKE